MPLLYKDLLSPIELNGVVLRNRLIATPSNPHFVQGPEKWPTEALITHYGNKAKAGAAVVTCKGNNPVKNSGDPHSQSLDITNGAHQHYFAQVAEAVHYYGAKASYLVLPNMNIVKGYDASDGIASEFVAGDGSHAELGRAAPRALLEQMVEEYASEAKLAKSLGFDMCFMHMAYRMMFPGRFLSPLTNQRQDEFGGSIANRARFPLMICEAIKEACGRDFLVEISITGREDDVFPGGVTVEDQIEFARLAEGKVDILQIRGASIDPSQPSYLDPREIPSLDAAAAIRRGIARAGTKICVDVVGGCQDLDHCNEIIAAGQADFIGAARSWIADPDWGNKAYEGRSEDVVPCLRCNKCHIPGPGKWNTVCSVNPKWGIEHKAERLVTPPARKKKLGIIGGGPAGMEAALISAQRGHEVTLYERSDRLGGLLKTMDGMGIKWTVTKYKEYLIRQVEKAGIRVLLNTEATPELVERENYDELIVAVGSSPALPPIPGAEGANVFFAVNAATREPELGRTLVIIGGGEIGVEMGIHLARKGHAVTVLEMQDQLSPESVPVHFRSVFEDTWERQEGFRYILNARCTGINGNQVSYLDAQGEAHSLPADSVVIAAGMRSNSAAALRFFTGTRRVHMIGDCDKVGSIQSATRAAYALANNL